MQDFLLNFRFFGTYTIQKPPKPANSREHGKYRRCVASRTTRKFADAYVAGIPCVLRLPSIVFIVTRFTFIFPFVSALFSQLRVCLVQKLYALRSLLHIFSLSICLSVCLFLSHSQPRRLAQQRIIDRALDGQHCAFTSEISMPRDHHLLRLSIVPTVRSLRYSILRATRENPRTRNNTHAHT